jgi:hypothetical protein
MAPSAPLGLEAEQRRRWWRPRRTVRRSASRLGAGGWRRQRTMRRLASRLGSGVPLADRGWHPARSSASWLGGGGAGGVGGGRCAAQPRGRL